MGELLLWPPTEPAPGDGGSDDDDDAPIARSVIELTSSSAKPPPVVPTYNPWGLHACTVTAWPGGSAPGARDWERKRVRSHMVSRNQTEAVPPWVVARMLGSRGWKEAWLAGWKGGRRERPSTLPCEGSVGRGEEKVRVGSAIRFCEAKVLTHVKVSHPYSGIVTGSAILVTSRTGDMWKWIRKEDKVVFSCKVHVELFMREM